MKRKSETPLSDEPIVYSKIPCSDNRTGIAAMMFLQKKITIVGSRSFTDQDRANACLDAFQQKLHAEKKCIQYNAFGGARGADTVGKKWADRRKILNVNIFPKGDLSKAATYHARNQRLVDNSDIVIAFWDMKSTGTLSTIKKARVAKKEIYIVDITKEGPLELKKDESYFIFYP